MCVFTEKSSRLWEKHLRETGSVCKKKPPLFEGNSVDGQSSVKVIGLFFFENNLKGERYRQLLNKFVQPKLAKRRRLSTTWFQQDGELRAILSLKQCSV